MMKGVTLFFLVCFATVTFAVQIPRIKGSIKSPYLSCPESSNYTLNITVYEYFDVYVCESSGYLDNSQGTVLVLIIDEIPSSCASRMALINSKSLVLSGTCQGGVLNLNSATAVPYTGFGTSFKSSGFYNFILQTTSKTAGAETEIYITGANGSGMIYSY